MEEYNKSYGANNHTSLLSHAQSQSPYKSILPHVCSVKNHRENQTVLRAINILISSLTWKSLLYRLLVINSSALIGYIFVFGTKCHSHNDLL